MTSLTELRESTMGVEVTTIEDGNGRDPDAELEALRERYNGLLAACVDYIAGSSTTSERRKAYAKMVMHIRQGRV